MLVRITDASYVKYIVLIVGMTQHSDDQTYIHNIQLQATYTVYNSKPHSSDKQQHVPTGKDSSFHIYMHLLDMQQWSYLSSHHLSQIEPWKCITPHTKGDWHTMDMHTQKETCELYIYIILDHVRGQLVARETQSDTTSSNEFFLNPFCVIFCFFVALHFRHYLQSTVRSV